MANAARDRALAAARARRRPSPPRPLPEEDIWGLDPEEFKRRLAADPMMVRSWMQPYREAARPIGPNVQPLNPSRWADFMHLVQMNFLEDAPAHTTANIVYWMGTLPRWIDGSASEVGAWLPYRPVSIGIEFIDHAASGDRHWTIKLIMEQLCKTEQSHKVIRTGVQILEHLAATSGRALWIGSDAYNSLSHALVQFDDADKWLMPLMVFVAKELCRNRDYLTLLDMRREWRQDSRQRGHGCRAWMLFHAMLLSRDAYETYLHKNAGPAGGGRYTPKDFSSRIRPFPPTREYNSDIEDAEEEDPVSRLFREMDEEAAEEAEDTGPMQLLSEALHENTTFPAEISAMIMNMYLGQDNASDPKLAKILKAKHTAPPIRKAEGEPEEEKENGAKRSKP